MKGTGLIPLLVLSSVVVGCGEREESGTPGTGPELEAESSEDTVAVPSDPSESADDQRLGPAVDRPERYFGVYAAPSRPGREWFITEARNPEYAEFAPPVPPGRLMLGAMFGDVAPWHLKTLSETEFVQARVNPGQDDPIAVEFRIAEDGTATAFRFTGGLSVDAEWLERTEDLPEEW